MRLAAILLLATLVPTPAEAGDRCVGWGIAGAVVGPAVGFYGVMGAYAVAGDPWGWGSTPGGMVAVLAAEEAGLILGPALTCGIFDPEPTLFPKASWMTAVGSAGLAVGLGAGFGWMRLAATPGSDHVGPEVVLPALALAVGGAAGGGWLGHRLYDAVYADQRVALWVEPEMRAARKGVRLRGRF